MPRSRKGNYSTDSDEGSSTGSSEYSHSSRRSDTSSDDEKDRTKGSRGHGSGSESSEEEDWSDEEALRRRRRRKRKRKEQQKQAMYLDYGIGALLLAVVVAGAYTWWQDQASTTTNVPSPSAGSLGATTKATTVKTSGTLKQSGGALTSKASSKFQSSSSPRPPPSSSKSSPAAPPASSPSQTTAAPPASGGGPYKLIADYSGEKFFNSWSFWDKDDPTHGQVDFLSREDATAANLISASADSAIMGNSTQRVDNTTTLGPGEFRKSVRIHSTAPITKGSLVIADIRLMPYGCGSWPAWWFHGADWPNGGELDILEGVSLQDVNHITTHVGSSECKLDRSAEVTGTIAADKTECNANLNGNAGCSYIEKSANSYGKAFNDAGGGVFLTLFTEDEVSSWFWSRPDVPQIITHGAPDVSKLGPPSAKWPSSTCASNFWANEQTLIFDITLCGDWAGAQGVWDDGCSDVAPTCLEYVQKADPWTTAVFEVAYVRVYSV